jgi:diamine N-acetyltransferase
MDQVIGDVAVHLDESGTIAEVGYTFASEHWGKGYASEAVGAVIDRLFSRHPEMVRVQAQMHPDNHASAGVAERCGLLYEGQTKLSFIPLPEDTGSQERSDNLIYGVIRDDWDQWQRRPTDAPDQVRLVELSNSNLDQVERLTTHKSQERMVAPVLVSIAQAFVPPVYDGALIKPWHRVVEADGQIVGFVMLATSDKSDRSPYLWRFLIDRGHQRRGIGGQVLDLIVDEVRRWRAERLFVSWVPGTGSPERFYRRHGFIPTGKIDESGEVEGVLRIH